MRSKASQTLYVGNLPSDIREWEIKGLFHNYGPIIDIDLKVPPRTPGYCFIEVCYFTILTEVWNNFFLDF